MKNKTLLTLALIGSLATGIGCTKKDNNLESKIKQSTPIVRTINGINYRFENNKVTELNSDEDNKAVYGCMSDIHGEVEKAKVLAQSFKKDKVDGIIIPGDIPKNEQLRYSQRDTKDDKIELKEVLEAIAGTGLPIFVIPGNHERKSDYEAALKEVTAKYNNVIDMTKYRIFDGDDVDFVSLPGYQTFKIPGKQFIPDDGYLATSGDIIRLKELREGLDDAVVLIAHGAGKTNARIGPATIYNGQDVGDELTTEIQKEANIPFAVVGHIHEAGGIAATFDGTPIMRGKFAKQFTVNCGTLEEWRYLDGSVADGMAVTFTIEGNKARYNRVYHIEIKKSKYLNKKRTRI